MRIAPRRWFTTAILVLDTVGVVVVVVVVAFLLFFSSFSGRDRPVFTTVEGECLLCLLFVFVCLRRLSTRMVCVCVCVTVMDDGD